MNIRPFEEYPTISELMERGDCPPMVMAKLVRMAGVEEILDQGHLIYHQMFLTPLAFHATLPNPTGAPVSVEPA